MSVGTATRWARHIDYSTRGMRRQQRDRARSLAFAFAATMGGSVTRMAEATGVENPEAARKRLERTILCQRFDLDRAWDRHRQLHLREYRAHRGRGTVVAVDGTTTDHLNATPKPVDWNEEKQGRWRGMDGVLQGVWHGSSGRKLIGHPYVNAEMVTASGLQVPLVLKSYDSNKAVVVAGKRLPRWKNDWLPHQEAIGEARHWSGDDAVYVFDRGYHLKTIGPPLDRWGLRFALRVSLHAGSQKKNAAPDPDDAGMWIARLDGKLIKLARMASEAKEIARFPEQRCRAERRGEGPSTVVLKAMPFRCAEEVGHKHVPAGPVRMLLVSDSYPEGIAPYGKEHRTRIAMVCDRELRDPDDMIWYRKSWVTRWKCETTYRFLCNRSGFGLQWEDRRQLDITAIRRMTLLYAQYSTFLSKLDQLGRDSPRIVEPLLKRVWMSPGRKPKDRRYQLALGFSRYLQDRLRQERLRRLRAQEPMWKRIWEPLVQPLPG